MAIECVRLSCSICRTYSSGAAKDETETPFSTKRGDGDTSEQYILLNNVVKSRQCIKQVHLASKIDGHKLSRNTCNPSLGFRQTSNKPRPKPAGIHPDRASLTCFHVELRNLRAQPYALDFRLVPRQQLQGHAAHTRRLCGPSAPKRQTSVPDYDLGSEGAYRAATNRPVKSRVIIHCLTEGEHHGEHAADEQSLRKTPFSNFVITRGRDASRAMYSSSLNRAAKTHLAQMFTMVRPRTSKFMRHACEGRHCEGCHGQTAMCSKLCISSPTTAAFD
eukprot:2718692-Pleurochrysis_carterae.AAC.3